MPKGVPLPRGVVECKACGRKIEKIGSQIVRSKNHYCSVVCKSRAKIKIRSCLGCGRKFKAARAHIRYCSRGCNLRILARARSDKSPSSKVVKLRLLDKFGACQRCGYFEVVAILEINHKDRNRKNKAEENLELLCPNCHTIEHLEAGDGQFFNNVGRGNAHFSVSSRSTSRLQGDDKKIREQEGKTGVLRSGEQTRSRKKSDSKSKQRVQAQKEKKRTPQEKKVKK
jgi:5-methylcytosine-specific restriction endonuclease McrA